MFHVLKNLDIFQKKCNIPASQECNLYLIIHLRHQTKNVSFISRNIYFIHVFMMERDVSPSLSTSPLSVPLDTFQNPGHICAILHASCLNCADPIVLGSQLRLSSWAIAVGGSSTTMAPFTILTRNKWWIFHGYLLVMMFFNGKVFYIWKKTLT